MIGYYSKETCDWRLCVKSTDGVSYLTIVGSKYMVGTILFTRRILEGSQNIRKASNNVVICKRCALRSENCKCSQSHGATTNG